MGNYKNAKNKWFIISKDSRDDTFDKYFPTKKEAEIFVSKLMDTDALIVKSKGRSITKILKERE